jgi:hypothetical protein
MQGTALSNVDFSSSVFWLGLHPEIQVPRIEIRDLKDREPWDLVATLYRRLESLNPNLLRGYKSPNDIGDVRPIRLLREFFPETKLLIGLRHPILMMQSFYNFRIQNGYDMIPFEHIQIGTKPKHHAAGMNRAEYHNDLANLGKTNMTNAELKLFSVERKRKLEKGGYQPKSPNKVFLYDTTQLNDKNKTRQAHFLRDLENYLGLTQELPPPLHFVPGKKVSSEKQKARDAKKINVCDEKYAKKREALIKIGTSAQKWILVYFLASPDVMVSNPEHFRQVLESYQFDPCLEKETNIVQNKSGFGV